ncbi:MAG: ATP-binding protein, partial [Muribaculum sp.]|nr:ATP-binding protein [Muribaculum sp.]
GRNVISDNELTPENSIKLGVIRHLGEDYEDEEVLISTNGLSKHTFVTGTTGSGKSNTLYLLISQLAEKGIKFLVIEPAKGEYKEVFGKRNDVHVYGSNPRVSDLLTINPFVFPEEIDIYEHIDALVEIFNACWPMYAAMPQVLKHSIIEAYKSCGWDLTKSDNPVGIYPTIPDVLDCLKDYINSSEYSSDTKGDYKGSLETRLQSLCEGIVGRMFNGTPITDEDLFNNNVIIDLSRVKSSETKSLLMGLLVLKLNEFRTSEHKGMNLPLRHVTILEEAHNLLKRTSTEQSSESSNVAGMAVEKIANSMAEMRTYGEGFIIADQSPSMLDLSAIRNTNTKIVMSLPEKDDREISGKALGLDDDHIEELSRLKTGEAIVYQSGWEEAVKTKVSYFNTDEIPWTYSPSGNDDDTKHKSIQDIFSTLYDKYVGAIDVIDIPNFMNLLHQYGLSGGRLHSIYDKYNSLEEITSDDVAFVFATIVGSEIFDSVKSIPDIGVLNIKLGRALNQFAGLDNDPRTMTFVNMYLKGSSLKSATPFYDAWLQATTKQS